MESNHLGFWEQPVQIRRNVFCVPRVAAKAENEQWFSGPIIPWWNMHTPETLIIVGNFDFKSGSQFR